MGAVGSRDVSAGEKGGEQEPPPAEPRLGTIMSNKQSSRSRQGVCPRGTLDEAQSTLRT